MKKNPAQLGLFGDEPAPQPAARKPAIPDVLPVEPDAETLALARALPPWIRMGTSSWSFPGWKGLTWQGQHTTTQLSRHGLRAYAAHPLLRTVGLDRSFYAPVPAEDLQSYGAQVPADFGMVVKAWEHLVIPEFPRHPRYGPLAGQVNPHFMDARTFHEEFWKPFTAPGAVKVDALVFEFSPMNVDAVGGPNGFAEHLEDFLRDMPRGVPLTVELRNTELMSRAYVDVLRRHGVAHVYNRWSRTPSVGEQLRRFIGPPWTEHVVARLMLPRGRGYDERLQQCEPFDRLVDEDHELRADMVELARTLLPARGRLLVVVNNKAEGSAPLTIRALAQGMVAALG